MDENYRFVVDGDKIRKSRLEKGYENIQQFSRKAGIAHSTLITIESGTRLNCYIDSLARIAKVLEVPIEKLLKIVPITKKRLPYKARKKKEVNANEN